MRFVEGTLRFADVEAWPDTLQQRHLRALSVGDFSGLVSTTSRWWGAWDPARTEAWLLMRFGRDGFGVRPPSEPFTDRVWPEGLNSVLEELARRPTSAKEVKVLRAGWQTSEVLPSTLRCFDQAGHWFGLKTLWALAKRCGCGSMPRLLNDCAASSARADDRGDAQCASGLYLGRGGRREQLVRLSAPVQRSRGPGRWCQTDAVRDGPYRRRRPVDPGVWSLDLAFGPPPRGRSEACRGIFRSPDRSSAVGSPSGHEPGNVAEA